MITEYRKETSRGGMLSPAPLFERRKRIMAYEHIYWGILRRTPLLTNKRNDRTPDAEQTEHRFFFDLDTKPESQGEKRSLEEILKKRLRCLEEMRAEFDNIIGQCEAYLAVIDEMEEEAKAVAAQIKQERQAQVKEQVPDLKEKQSREEKKAHNPQEQQHGEDDMSWLLDELIRSGLVTKGVPHADSCE